MFSLLISLINVMTISGPGYFTLRVSDKYGTEVNFNLEKVEGYEYFFVFSSLSYEQISSVLIPGPVTKVASLKTYCYSFYKIRRS